MDCQKCGYALTAFEKDCPRCRRVAAEEFARSPAAVWPPAVGPQIAPAPVEVALPGPQFTPQELDNSSGEERGGPPEIEDLHWNWGAFFCGWLWCFFHKAPGLGAGVIAAGLFLAAFNIFILPAGYALPSELMALVVFGLCCYLGMTGHRTAWERRRFLGGVPQYFAVQRAWTVGGAAAFGVTVAFCVTLGLLFMAAFRSYEARRQAAPAEPISAPAPSVPAPIVLRPSPPSGPVYLRRPMESGDSPEGRRFDPAHPGQMFRPTGPAFRPPDPSDHPDVLPPGSGPNSAPPQNISPQNISPQNVPAQSVPFSAPAQPPSAAPPPMAAPGVPSTEAPPSSVPVPSAPAQALPPAGTGQ